MLIEVSADLWGIQCDVRCITTNGTIKKDGSVVMGRGCALEAKTKYPDLPYLLGDMVKSGGNHVCYFRSHGIVAFPVKHHWQEKASMGLIIRSAKELVTYANIFGWIKVAVPRPGCGNGQLNWEDVKPVLEEILDDRFVVVNK